MSYSSSEPEAQDYGFTLPKGTDLIREGDNAITTNALVTTGALRAAFNRLRTLEDAPAPVAEHGSLTGLGDDDHPQYLTNARGDGRYSPLGHTHPPTSWAEVTDKPTAFPPSAHVHTPAEVGSVPADDPRLRDTGWRVIPTDTTAHPLADGTVQVRRVGSVVTLKIVNVQLAASTESPVRFIPSSGGAAFNATGFLPSTSRLPFFASRTNSVTDRHSMVVWTSGNNLALFWYHRESIDVATSSRGVTLPASTQLTGEISWLTDQPWPTTLPGTPA